ncbi:MAG TPA: glutathione S-transferase family protein [Steroidobacteraceae bacterium]
MSLTLYAHPFAAYCWKVWIGLYENATPFTYRVVEDEAGWQELAALWPIRKFPVLTDGARTIVESTIIVEYLDRHFPGPVPMIPVDTAAALQARTLDRVFDNYVMTPMQSLVAAHMRPESERDAKAMADARRTLDAAYGWLERQLTPGTWLCEGRFSLAECAGAPALFYADWVHPLAARFPGVAAYRRRVLARPAVARVVDEARPYRKFFPPGAPDRD